MRKHREEEMGLLVRKFLREQGLETPLNEYRVVQLWPQVVGQAIARFTGEIYVRGGILFVQIRSAALRENLSHQRTQLCRRLNAEVGAQVLNEVRFF